MACEVDVIGKHSRSVALTFSVPVLLMSAVLTTSPVPVTVAAAQPARAASAEMTGLWSAPDDFATRGLFAGPWGVERAPDPHAVYTFVEPKRVGVNPGMTVRDPGGREWTVNPFVGSRPLNGLLVILLIFNSSDLKSSNNSLYTFQGEAGAERWYAVRDLGTALGSTARLTPIRGDPAVFARLGFIKQAKGGYVQFEYGGRHQELFASRITPDDVAWACALLGRLSQAQWLDAFRAGGDTASVSERFIGTIREKIAQGLALAELTER